MKISKKYSLKIFCFLLLKAKNKKQKMVLITVTKQIFNYKTKI